MVFYEDESSKWTFSNIQDPSERPGFVELQQFPLFHDLDWSHLLEQEAPFVPQPDDETDTCYFEARNRLQQWQVSQIVDN